MQAFTDHFDDAVLRDDLLERSAVSVAFEADVLIAQQILVEQWTYVLVEHRLAARVRLVLRRRDDRRPEFVGLDASLRYGVESLRGNQLPARIDLGLRSIALGTQSSLDIVLHLVGEIALVCLLVEAIPTRKQRARIEWHSRVHLAKARQLSVRLQRNIEIPSHIGILFIR